MAEGQRSRLDLDISVPKPQYLSVSAPKLTPPRVKWVVSLFAGNILAGRWL